MHPLSFSFRPGRLLAAALLLAPASALAAGVFYPDNGAGVLAMGGTSTGVLDTAYALKFNPAGMALVDGIDVRLDVNLLNSGETFQPAFGNPTHTTVSNTGGISPWPYIAATYRLPIFFGQRVAVGLGIWAPPGVLNYTFPNPNSYPASTAAEATPQRYNNISQQSIVLLPSASLAWQPLPWISLGGTLSYVYSSIALNTSLLGTPLPLGFTGVSGDLMANLKNLTANTNQWTGTVGAIIQPLKQLVPAEFDGLILAGSFSPTLPITSTGQLEITPGSALSGPPLNVQIGSTSGTTPDATLHINLPPIARAGFAYKWARLTSSAEFHWEGWHYNDQFTVTTNATATTKLTGTSAVQPLVIVNEWQDSYGGRVGFAYDFLRPSDYGFLLQGAVGGLYETNAIPTAHQTLPYVTGNLGGGSLGVSCAYHGFGIAFSALILAPQSFTVTNSVVQQPVGLPDKQIPPNIIGNGNYTTNVWELGIGLFYRGLDGRT